jgi:NADH:ubiquinone oxidoreductase subunit F (NADH-binding)
VADGAGPRYVLATGEEGEPASWKDRYLLRKHPHLVLEGVALAALATGSDEAWIYVADPVAEQTLVAAASEALEQLPELGIHVVKAPHTYVGGEETAAVRYVNEGLALPTAKPPRPFEGGIRGRPTVVNNVESLAHAAWIAAYGSPEFRSVGTERSPGTFLACVSGAVQAPILLEAPLGVPLVELVATAGPLEELAGVLLGGYFSGFLPASLINTPAEYDALRAIGFGLGNGTVVAIGASVCPVRVISELLAFFAAASSGQCGPCVRGTAAMRDIAQRMRTGHGTTDDLVALKRYGETLLGRGACQLLDAAAHAATQSLVHFTDRLTDHIGSTCASCLDNGAPAVVSGDPLAVEALLTQGCT